MIRLFEFTGPHTYEPAKHKLFRFPAGESHIQLVDPRSHQVAFITGSESGELFDIAMWASICYRRRLETTLIMPYLPGARADKTGDNDAYGAGVYAEFINSLRLDDVVCLDPHSEVMPSMLDNLTTVYASDVIPPAVVDQFDGIIAPDKGAVGRALYVAKRFSKPLFRAEKVRDFTTGKLSGFKCEELPDGRFLIVDDICDGGGTFVGLAECTGLPPEKLGLWVSHGVFSKGIVDLQKRFSYIGCTDSHPGSAQVENVVPIFRHLLRATNNAIQSA